jgi:putative ABC transport system permease protein
MITGITLGVAVAVAIDLANTSASRGFDLSAETVTGRATHQIVGGPAGLPENLYAQILRAGVISAAAPVISEYVSSPQLGGQPLQLLGVDPFAEAPFRDYLGSRLGGVDSSRPAPLVGDLTTFLTRPGAILISTGLAREFGLKACPSWAAGSDLSNCQVTLEVAGQERQAFIAGLLQAADPLSQRALDGLILADLATAQELTGRLGKIDHIDLILTESCQNPSQPKDCPAALGPYLPADAHLQSVEARTGTIKEMTAAFRINLTALSLLALVVGLFLIYNTMTFSVVQRRPLFGTLRCLGITRIEIFTLVLAEALIVGVLGSALGIALGVLAGQAAIQIVTRTINDLYFVLSVRGIQIPTSSLVKGAVLGVAATLMAAIPPAWEAASVSPRLALSRSGLESKVLRAVWLSARIGLVTGLLGAGLLLFPTRNLVISFAGTFAVIISFAMLAPVATAIMMRLSGPLLGRLWGTLGRMAPRDVINSLSRTSVAVAALMVAVSVTIGVSLMVSSFRHTVITWLAQTLQGDVYISAPSNLANRSSTDIEPRVLPVLEAWPGVRRVLILRSATIDSPFGPVQVAASSNADISIQRSYLSTEAPISELEGKLQEGWVIVSEPFANRLGLPHHAGQITLFTDQGAQVFPVAGIYYDYASTQGTVTMSIDTYRRYWNDPAITAIALILEPGVDTNAVIKSLQSRLAPLQKLLIRSNQALRQEVLVVFDRTFAITGALQLLATVVAFIGVLSALLSLELERQRELGILRAVGLTVRQLWALIALETGLLGAVAGLLSMPTGYLLALILVYIINRRSFGWTLQMHLYATPFLTALLVAETAALLAGVYPSLRMGRIAEADAMRFD